MPFTHPRGTGEIGASRDPKPPGGAGPDFNPDTSLRPTEDRISY